MVATVAIAFLRMSIGGEAIEVGMPLRVATDPAYQGRGIFRELQAANEERVRGLGIRLLLTVPNAASAPVFVEQARLDAAAVAPRLGARARLRSALRRPRMQVARFGPRIVGVAGRSRPRAPRRGLAQLALRRRADAVHAARGQRATGSRAVGDASAWSRPSRASCSADAAVAAGGPGAIASPPPWQRSPLLARRLRPDAQDLHRARKVAPPRAAGPAAAALRARRPRLPLSAIRLRRDRPPRPEGRRHLGLGGAPAAAAAGARAARLGRSAS